MNLMIVDLKVMSRRTEVTFTQVAVCMLVAATCMPPARARPPWLTPGRPSLEATAECHTDEELLDLCQRCAKLTKSPLAYPSCCSADLQARNWCADFVYFGRGYYEYDD